MKYIFLDFEMNQTFQAENSKFKVKSRFDYLSEEIIEFGAIMLDDNLELVKEFQCYVKPYILNDYSPRIKRLTKIKFDTVINKGLNLGKAIQRFNEFLPLNENYIIYTWGEDDYNVLFDNCIAHNVNLKYIPWAKNIIDLQERFSKIYKYKFKKNKIGMDKVIKYYNITRDSRRHKALNDAKYTSEIFRTMYKRLGIKNLIKVVEKDEIYRDKQYKLVYNFLSNNELNSNKKNIKAERNYSINQ